MVAFRPKHAAYNIYIEENPSFASILLPVTNISIKLAIIIIYKTSFALLFFKSFMRFTNRVLSKYIKALNLFLLFNRNIICFV